MRHNNIIVYRLICSFIVVIVVLNSSVVLAFSSSTRVGKMSQNTVSSKGKNEVTNTGSSARLVPVQVMKKTKISMSVSVSKFDCLASSDSDASTGHHQEVPPQAPPQTNTDKKSQSSGRNTNGNRAAHNVQTKSQDSSSAQNIDGSEKKKWRRIPKSTTPLQSTTSELPPPPPPPPLSETTTASSSSTKSNSVFSIIAPNQATKGQYVNVFWRSVPMDDLRAHPNFFELPLSEQVVLSSLKDLTLYRQDSWQWDALHQGRLTTSKLASIIGFYERQSGKVLNIPNSLQGHERAVSAWSWVRRKPPTSWDHLSSDSSTSSEKRKDKERNIWTSNKSSTNSQNFVYHYQPDPKLHSKLSANYKINCPSSARMAWGSAQESTAVLAVVNYFLQNETTAQVYESGMCVFEALDEVHTSSTSSTALSEQTSEVDKLYQTIHKAIEIDKTLPLLGASPDALIRYEDGRIEVVEVKCFSPFVTNDRNGNNGKGQQALAVSSFRPASEQQGSIPVWHIPQIQLEIFCAGKSCESALLVVLYVDGAKMYRVARDTEYTMEMLHWAQEFYKQFVLEVPANKMKSPPENFFHPNQLPRYAQFLQRTIQLAQSAVCVAELTHEDIQRSPYNLNFFV